MVLPVKDRRLQQRYRRLVREHAHTAERLAAGLSALPRGGHSFASTQACWRFLQNESISLGVLADPLLELGRQQTAASLAEYVLLVHDWSKLRYEHASKTDLVELPGRENWGYDLSVALLVDAADGVPLAPLELALHSAQGVHSTRGETHVAAAHIDQVLATMTASRSWQLPRPAVHVVDREADGLAQYREWSQAGHLFLIRGDGNRCVLWEGKPCALAEIGRQLSRQGAFVEVREVSYHGRPAQQFVAEAAVTLVGPGRKRSPQGRVTIPGTPLALRLVISQVRDLQGRLLAVWYLLTNLPPEVAAETVALWYYWRWNIESFFKLMKSHGMEMETWLQHDGLRIAKRLLVAALACAAVWQLRHDPSPAAREMEQLLVKISGRQTKRRRPVTMPALLSGLQSLLAVLGILEDYTPQQLRQLLARTLPLLADTS
jgi:hypothetical protein